MLDGMHNYLMCDQIFADPCSSKSIKDVAGILRSTLARVGRPKLRKGFLGLSRK